MQMFQARHSPAAMTVNQADIFYTTPVQQRSMYLFETSSFPGSNKEKGAVSKTASPSSSSRPSATLVPSTRSRVSTPCQLPGEESLGEFMKHLMNLRLPDAKQVIFVQQNGQ